MLQARQDAALAALPEDQRDFIAFADFLIGSHWIGFMNDRKGIYKFLVEPEFVSATFEQAIRLIIADSTKIYV